MKNFVKSLIAVTGTAALIAPAIPALAGTEAPAASPSPAASPTPAPTASPAATPSASKESGKAEYKEGDIGFTVINGYRQ